MPPKMYPIIAPPSPVIPTEINDDHDILCVMDMLDTLDSIPGELTQRFGDLRELDAVLNATTVHLTSRLEALTRILQQASSSASSSTSTSASTFNSTSNSTSKTSAVVASIAKSPVQSHSAMAAPPPPVTSSLLETEKTGDTPGPGDVTSNSNTTAMANGSTVTLPPTPTSTSTTPILTADQKEEPELMKMKIDQEAQDQDQAQDQAQEETRKADPDTNGDAVMGPETGIAAGGVVRDVDEGGPAEQPENTTVDQAGDKLEKGVDEAESGPAAGVPATAAAKAVKPVEDVVEPPAAGDTGNTGAGGDAAEPGGASANPKDSDAVTALDPDPASKAVTMDIDPVPTTSPDQNLVSAPVPPVGTHSAQDPVNVSVSTATAGEPALALDQPWDRFQILLEIAEELSRFKVGVEDKVKVAGSACDHVIQHQSHIASLLSSSTLLLPAYPTSHLNNQQGYLPQQTLDRGMTNGGTSSSGVGGKRHRNSPMPSRYANLVSTNGNPNGGGLSGGMQNPNASSGNHANGNGSGSAGYGQAYAPAPGSETPSKKRRKTGAGAGGQGAGGKEKKGSGAAAGGPGWWDEEEGGSGKGGKRWDGRSQPQNPFNADPRGGSNPFTSPYPDYPSHLQQTTNNNNNSNSTTTTGAGGKQRNSPSVAGSVRGGSVMPSITGDAGSKPGNAAGGGGKKKSGAGAGGTKKQGQAAGAGGEGKSAQGSASTASTAGGGGGRKKAQGKSGLATAGAGAGGQGGRDGTGEEYGYYNTGGSHPAGISNGGVGGQAGSRVGSGPGSGAQNHHNNHNNQNHNHNRGHKHEGESGLDHDMDHDHDHDQDPEGDADADADTRLYCYCQKQSYGEMIGCDDDGCQFEWFHLSCLLLDRPPEGTWLCPDCAVRAESKKKRGGGGKGGGGGRKGK